MSHTKPIRVDVDPDFLKEFQEVRNALQTASSRQHALDRVVFAVKQAILADPEAAIHMGEDPDVYLWQSNEADKRQMLSIYYVLEGDRAVLMSIQQGLHLVNPSMENPPNL